MTVERIGEVLLQSSDFFNDSPALLQSFGYSDQHGPGVIALVDETAAGLERQDGFGSAEVHGTSSRTCAA